MICNDSTSQISVVHLEALQPISNFQCNFETLLKAVGGLVAENPAVLSLAVSGSSSSGPRLLAHNVCSKR
jgi:hypothetical protein